VVNVLTENGVLREDLRQSFGGLTGTASGTPIALTVSLVTADSCAALAGAAIYLWHCDAEGHYSLYDLPRQNYLRGLGVADAAGKVRFSSVMPGCYPGRWPHMHFEVFADADQAISGAAARLTSQFALPEAEMRSAYAAERAYAASSRNIDRVSLTRDSVFRDNSASEMDAMMLRLTGDPKSGFNAEVTVAVP
jgi:protocatechuate 3,4-dioxygenase beta subunit